MNAVMRENSEAFVTGNETIERSIASLREKMDRDHAALAAGQAALAASQASLHTSQAVLAANQTAMAASQAAMAANQTALAANLSALNDRVHQNFSTLSDKINTVHHVLRDEIKATSKEFHAKLEAVDHKMDALSAAFGELRGFHKTVLSLCGGIVTLVGLAFTIARAIGWI